MSKIYKIAVLPGDGIGSEVMAQALRVLEVISKGRDFKFDFQHALVGGAAYETFGVHFPEETNQICQTADAILFGSVGGPVAEQHLPKWKNCEANSLLAIRKSLGFAINLRPVKIFPTLKVLSPIKDHILERGVDIMIVRELVGDIYFGDKYRQEKDGVLHAYDLASYSVPEIEAVARYAFKLAQSRKKLLHSVDKANVLETSRLWRETLNKLHREFQDVKLEHILVDNCAMQLVRNPSQFDVLLCPNMFGDILSDQAAVLPGSLGLLPSASLTASSPTNPGKGFYEPSGGSAPDIAGKGIANPIAQILSASMMLNLSFNLKNDAIAIEKAIERTIAKGYVTQDLSSTSRERALSTQLFTDKLIEEL
jgi:3-isopropylmalate dehydrogenase